VRDALLDAVVAVSMATAAPDWGGGMKYHGVE